jgi:DNA-directed RNA polymerase subunit RPC12/RpoP
MLWGVLNNHMNEATVRLVCPECGKDWQTDPVDLPESGRTFHCPNCHASRRLSEYLHTERDLQVLQKLG